MKKLTLLLFAVALNAVSFSGSGEFTANSKQEACDKALVFAKENAIEKSGTTIKSEFSILQSDINNELDSAKKRELIQTSNGIVKLISKENEVFVDPKTYQFTCKINAVFEIGESQPVVIVPTQPTKAPEIEAKKPLLRAMLGFDSDNSQTSGARILLGVFIMDKLLFKFGNGAEKALINQSYNFFENLNYSLADSNSRFGYYYSTLALEYYLLEYYGYFLTFGGNVNLFDNTKIFFANGFEQSKLSIGGYLANNFYPQMQIALGYQFYKLSLVLTPNLAYTYDGTKYEPSAIRIGLSVAIPINL